MAVFVVTSAFVPVSPRAGPKGCPCRFGYIDKTGNALPPPFVDTQNFAEGLAAVVQQDTSQHGWFSGTAELAEPKD